MTILRNDGAGNFVQRQRAPRRRAHQPRRVAAADFDGDGDQDLAVANQGGGVTILRNIGSGELRLSRATSPEAADQTPTSLFAADLDGDADRDLAVANIELRRRDDSAQPLGAADRAAAITS